MHYFYGELITILFNYRPESQGLWVGWELKSLYLAFYILSNPFHNLVP